jgi:hypothetical protein
VLSCSSSWIAVADELSSDDEDVIQRDLSGAYISWFVDSRIALGGALTCIAGTLRLLTIMDADTAYKGAPVAQPELPHVGAVFTMPTPLVAFDFDVHYFALEAIGADRTLALWSIRDKQPFWANEIRGNDVPSSVAFINGGATLGRRNRTVFQLLPVTLRAVSATVRFAVPNTAAVAGTVGRTNYAKHPDTSGLHY